MPNEFKNLLKSAFVKSSQENSENRALEEIWSQWEYDKKIRTTSHTG